MENFSYCLVYHCPYTNAIKFDFAIDKMIKATHIKKILDEGRIEVEFKKGKKKGKFSYTLLGDIETRGIDNVEDYEEADYEDIYAEIHDWVSENIVAKMDIKVKDSAVGDPKLKHQLLDLIKEHEKDGGIMFDDIKKKLTYSPEELNKEIKKLLEDGMIYEPRPSKLRYLG